MTSTLVATPTLAAPTFTGSRRPGGRHVTIAGRDLETTAVFDTYWRFAAARQAIYQARQEGSPGPWTNDPILATHRFTNCFRAADRVSQQLIGTVAYSGDQDPTETTFRVLLFKLFNRSSTWARLTAQLGELRWSSFDIDAYDHVLSSAFARGERLYSPAYVIPPPRLGAARKHTNHLRFLRQAMNDGLVDHLRSASSLQQAFTVLRDLPALGDFLAFQFAIDLNYSTVLNFDEMDFVVAGPGAKDGIRKCFGPASAGIETQIIEYMTRTQTDHFDRLGLRFDGLRGRPLHLIDAQNLFCEVDKYARVAHPTILGLSGRSRIKQKFRPASRPDSAWFPPKWGLTGASAPARDDRT